MFRVGSVARDLLSLIRDYSKGITDDTIKGLLRSIGDAGATPANTSGKTVLQLLSDLYTRVRSLDGDTGTQVTKNATAEGSTVIVHTVTTGKTLYLTGYSFSGKYISADGDTRVYVRDDSDNEVFQLTHIAIFNSAPSNGLTLSFPMPIKIPAGYDICVVADTGVRGIISIFGWEE